MTTDPIDVEALLAHHEATGRQSAGYIEDLRALAAEVVRLREQVTALKDWVVHDRRCAVRDADDCDCGLDAVLAAGENQ